jgi:hypothetical protein
LGGNAAAWAPPALLWGTTSKVGTGLDIIRCLSFSHSVLLFVLFSFSTSLFAEHSDHLGVWVFCFLLRCCLISLARRGVRPLVLHTSVLFDLTKLLLMTLIPLCILSISFAFGFAGVGVGWLVRGQAHIIFRIFFRSWTYFDKHYAFHYPFW